MPAHKQHLPTRFWAKVEKTDECWLWTGATFRDGYGMLQIDGRARKAHRVAYELTHGLIPNGIQVLHRCDNPPCCNPEHLFLGTNKDNIHDMLQKGRARPPRFPGELHPRAKLTSTDVHIIRARHAAGTSGRQLAREYNIGNTTMRKLLNGETWKEVI